ncbi:MAG: AAA family ATPase [Gammaproteobacteria bacterium]|nr:AAA family ATPase [Gammaproteobacteria bacterium]MCW8911457.1 AAA family ATPase [Gammaproteobacteria bacterium]MCW9003764.1 AAA family ATPase [Gammaproteobacteria bacterium]MCW9057121.1 AAA family ATPase [Gammaproteobacteria bacterium]
MNSQQDILLSAMLKPGFYPDPTNHVELIETHISQVFLTGQYAYKIKKPVNFGFVNFTDLNKRKFYCEEEVRLNGRLAPDVYLDVIPITKSDNQIAFNGDGIIIEYAIKMKQFNPTGLLINLAKDNKLTIDHIISLANIISEFHQNIAKLDSHSTIGEADEILKPVIENFNILEPVIDRSLLVKLNKIKEASLILHNNLKSSFVTRKQNGFIRECHGDLHLGNIALINNKIVPFDGIEFNDSFRWIDTISDIGFLIMDLEDHHYHEYACEFLNQYLEITGDYPGLCVLGYYKIYRAMVRAKVSGLRLQQLTTKNDEYTRDIDELKNYLNLAEKYCNKNPVSIIITHGISGSGKSYLADKLKNRIKAIVIHSDRERKRLFSRLKKELYSSDTTDKVYRYLLESAKAIIDSGYSAIIDATFLNFKYREEFKRMADSMEVSFFILNCKTSKHTLESRIVQRDMEKTSLSDADLTVMHKQIASYKPLKESELAYTIKIHTESKIDLEAIYRSLTSIKN